jgi:hypothetical protein
MTMHPTLDLHDALDPQLADMVAEAVVWSHGADERAETVLQILMCTVDAIHWRLQPDGDPAEENSLEQVLRSAAQHLDRMQPTDLTAAATARKPAASLH